MKLKLSDNKVIGLLLVALILQILLLLWHMELVGPVSKQAQSNDGVMAGQIRAIENSLKRRPLDSLIWEESQAPEKVYFHDSILTLSESTARIELENGTQINLSENTLITIEPEAESLSGEIRIRMSQGNLKARNPYNKALIADETTLVKIDADSDVDIVKTENGRVEILVNKGKADVEFQDNSFAISQNELMVFSDDGAKKDKMSENLRWNSKKLIRHYTHLKKAHVLFDWTGPAEKIHIEQNGKSFKVLPINNNSISIPLPLGNYQAHLQGPSGRSKGREVQVWQAPKIQLVLPRPRDRKPTGPLQFVWTPEKNVDSYELVLNGKKENLRFPSARNKTNERVSIEDDFRWEVWGVDKKGFKIPPAYSYPLFIRENPFAPPKLKKPKIFKEPDSVQFHWWHYLFIPSAQAEQPVAVFSWEPISGAEIYFIEISKDKEFRDPVVKEKLGKPHYQWKTFDENETYYWRVAAGDQSGRMGIFSEPTLVDWDYVLPEKPRSKVVTKRKPTPTVKTKAKLRKPPAQRTNTPPPPKSVAAPKAEPTQVVDLEPRDIFRSFSFFYLPSFGLKSYKEGGQTKANLEGFNLLSAGLEVEVWLTRQSILRWYTKFSQVEYEPQPKSAFPFQPNINTRNWINQLIWSQQDFSWGFGAIVVDFPSLKRKSYEQVTIEQQLAFGLIGEKVFKLGSGQWSSTLSLLSSQSQIGVGSSQRVLFPLFFDGFRFGAEAEVLYFGESENSDLVGDLYLILGWQF